MSRKAVLCAAVSLLLAAASHPAPIEAQTFAQSLGISSWDDDPPPPSQGGGTRYRLI
jgi:hypothetical protein